MLPPQPHPSLLMSSVWFLVFYIFLSLLNNCILLDYVTAHGHPLLVQTWHGIDFISFICTWDSHHITTTATNQEMMKGAATTTTTTPGHTHIHHNFIWHSGEIFSFFHCFFLFLIFYSACKATVSFIVTHFSLVSGWELWLFMKFIIIKT